MAIVICVVENVEIQFLFIDGILNFQRSSITKFFREKMRLV